MPRPKKYSRKPIKGKKHVGVVYQRWVAEPTQMGWFIPHQRVQKGDVIVFDMGDGRTHRAVVEVANYTIRPMTEADREPGDTAPLEGREIVETTINWNNK